MTAGDVLVTGGQSRWRRRLVAPVLAQLRQGISMERISWTIALGIVLGMFPVVGTTSMLCALVAWALKLNQPVMHAFNWLVYPLHLASILLFIRLGERLHGVPPLSFSLTQMMAAFRADPLQFGRDFGLAAWHGVSAWLLIAPFAVLLIKLLLTPVVRTLAVSLKRREVKL
ncbi:MAG: DUF2062 domain-containing protein [Verrucomicrobiota bacterium]